MDNRDGLAKDNHLHRSYLARAIFGSASAFSSKFLALWSMDEKVGKLDNRAEAEFKIALAKYYHTN